MNRLEPDERPGSHPCEPPAPDPAARRRERWEAASRAAVTRLDRMIDLVFNRTPRWAFFLVTALTSPCWWVIGDEIFGRSGLSRSIAEATGLSRFGVVGLVCVGVLVCNASAFVYVMRPLFDGWEPEQEQAAAQESVR